MSTTFFLQMDKSTHVAGLAVLLVFVRYIYEGNVEEDLLICQNLEAHTTGEAIFNLIDSYMKENNISWDFCSSVCTGGAAAMIEKISGVVTRIKKKNPDIESIH